MAVKPMPSFELMQHWGAVCWAHQVGMHRDAAFSYLACPVEGCNMGLTDEVLQRSGWTMESYYPLLVNTERELSAEENVQAAVNYMKNAYSNVGSGAGGGGGGSYFPVSPGVSYGYTVGGGGGGSAYSDGTGGKGSSSNIVITSGRYEPDRLTATSKGGNAGASGFGEVAAALQRVVDAARDAGLVRYRRT